MEKIFNQELIKSNLIISSMFVTSFEMLKSSIQERLKGFLCINSKFNEDEEIEFEISDDFKNQVLERDIPKINRRKYRDYHLFYSSCLWLKDNNVIDSKDLEDIEMIRKHRNLLSHNPLKLLVDENTNVNKELLKKCQKLLSKIEKWWILNFEIPVNPEFDGQEIKEEDVKSGRTIYLDYLMEIIEKDINKNCALHFV